MRYSTSTIPDYIKLLLNLFAKFNTAVYGAKHKRPILSNFRGESISAL